MTTFTGLVRDLGEVAGTDGERLTVRTRLAAELAPGDSIAVDGVCVTAVERTDGAFVADVVVETRRRSTLGAVRPGVHVNLELALRASDRLGGHVMQGHVDGVGAVVATDPFTVQADPALLRYVVEKGSIAVSGVSLTVAAVQEDRFSVALIPETLQRTTLGTAGVGAPVNLEVDVFAKYVEKLCAR